MTRNARVVPFAVKPTRKTPLEPAPARKPGGLTIRVTVERADDVHDKPRKPTT